MDRWSSSDFRDGLVVSGRWCVGSFFPMKPLSLPAIINMSAGFFGIQFGWGLQMANMSAIYQYLGAAEGEIPILWLAAPLLLTAEAVIN